MDEPVPLRRAAVGCLLLALTFVALALLVRPAIFNVALPTDDAAVIVATASEVTTGAIRRDVVLSRSRGWSGERDAGDGRVQVTVILAPSSTVGGISAVNAASPGGPGCPIEIGTDRLTDCDGRAWTFEGFPIDPADAPLERVPAEVASGSVVLDLTRPDGEERTRPTGQRRPEAELRREIAVPRVISRRSLPSPAAQPRVDSPHGSAAAGSLTRHDACTSVA